MQFDLVAQQRLIAQHIRQADFKSVAHVVSYIGAMQAQDYTGALWAIALRTQALTMRDVEDAIADRKILRTWPMRGTLHFLAADDARWITQLLAPRVVKLAAARERQLALDETTFARAREIISTALAGGKRLRRTEFVETLEKYGIQTANQRGYHILWRLAQEGFICFGPHAGKQPTFVLLDEWLPNVRQLEDREEALGELATRYFTSHGPATLKDFAGWGGMTIKDARIGIERAGSALKKTTVGTTDYWQDPALVMESGPSAFLLPGFDEFMLGYKDRSPSLAPAHANKIVPGNNGMFLATIVVDGHVVGTWKKVIRKSGVTISLEPFAPLNAGTLQQLQGAAERYGTFLGTTATIA